MDSILLYSLLCPGQCLCLDVLYIIITNDSECAPYCTKLSRIFVHEVHYHSTESYHSELSRQYLALTDLCYYNNGGCYIDHNT